MPRLKRGMTIEGRSFAISPRVFTRVLPEASLPQIRGRRECRALDAPAALCAVKVKAHKRSHHGHTGNTRHSPRNGFNSLYRALPGDRAFLPPSPLRSLLLKNLTPASGCRDHTTSPSASSALVRSAACVHRIPSRVRDDCEPPLCGTGPDRYNSASTPASSIFSEIPKLCPPSFRGARATKQSILSCRGEMDCFAALAMTVFKRIPESAHPPPAWRRRLRKFS